MKAILLIPTPGDVSLLAPGKCGARPPIAIRAFDLPIHVRMNKGVWVESGSQKATQAYERDVCALVLAWDGEPVPEGCDRALRAYAAAPPIKGHRVYAEIRREVCWPYLMEEALEIAQHCVARLGGEVVVLP